MAGINKLSEDKLWKKYKQNDSQAAKEELILRYIPLIKHIVGKIMVTIPDEYTFDDLVNYGVLGLIDAMKRFDYQRGIKFSTYALPRIKGAIYDELRRLDWVPTSIRRQAKEFAEVLGRLENKLGRSPTDEELKEELNLTNNEYNKLLARINISDNISLDKVITQQKNGLKIKDIIKSVSQEEPDQIFSYNETKRILGEAIDKLPDKEKLVISLYYHDDLTLQEIGEVMELTTARISQLHTKAIFRLRGHLSRKKDLLLG
ncbi:RNA polymerase sigma factor, FliA/WhiG family [Halobacteroides halobius DSM 5150]|uniref:RNA polymerase sigma factor, FliA/WhiG family n=1 Tax=Halobacteroides halobius (strain ATCC 35273 / DSM 5150 / MD-1) TaxID=748449 RepID=L0K957_HALHC|nr:FliA/WhiG family RNA polymerase sigma factor [Halobacteroides halobius]AGB40653.1 RNA polymerase sigma factor, FliA/WhiG family [Halobacteroides halobius DSM 5150]